MSNALTDLPGIGPSIAVLLSKHGLKTLEDIAASDVDTLCALPGFGPVKAKATIAAAAALITTPPEPEVAEPAQKPEKTKPAAKAKKKKKSKKSGKSKKADKKKKSAKKKKSKSKSKKSGKKKKKK